MITIKRCSGVREYRTIRSEALRSDPEAFGELYESFITRDDQDIDRYLKDINNGSSKIVDLMIYDNEIIGMCGYGAGDDGIGFIWGVYIRPSFRGTGCAINLLSHCIGNIWKMGATIIKAKVAAPNMRAIGFYKKLGFKISDPVGMLRPSSSTPVFEITKSAQQGDAPEPAAHVDRA